MKNIAIALILGSVSSKNLNDAGSIWDESTEALFNVCGNPWTRWGHASNSWNTYVKAYQGNSDSNPYQESDFGANMESIYGKSTAPPSSGARIQQYENWVTGWKRPKDFQPGEKPSLKGTIDAFSPHGIKQGGLSDCWFLAGVTAIAENANRMNQIVHINSRKNYNTQGIFRYFFWVKNKWVPINIDDRLPAGYKYSNSKDYFAPFGARRSTYKAWWMPLLEKAYSKLNGNFDRIEWGSGYESLRQLSARPVFFFLHKKINGFENKEFALFQRMAREDYPMVVSCCDVPRNSKAPDGLQNAHAYTLLDLIDLDGTKLVKIRNPWSTEGYNGAWSDKDSRWTPALLKKAGHVKANDGVFFMPFHQFLNAPYFRSTTAAIYKNFQSSWIYNVQQTVQQKTITLTVPSRQVVYVTLESMNPRFKKNCKGATTQLQANTYFFKGTRFPGNAGLLTPVGYMGSSMYHVTVGEPDMALNAGTYTIMVANWSFGKGLKSFDYSVTVYQEGSGKVGVKL